VHYFPTDKIKASIAFAFAFESQKSHSTNANFVTSLIQRH